MTTAAKTVGGAVLLFLSVAGAGCAARRARPKLVVPRRCISALELTDKTECVPDGKGGLTCTGFKLKYSCTEVRRAPATR